MKRSTCRFAVIAAIITVLCVLVAFCVPVFTSEHDCKGEDCEICALISLCRNLIITAGAAAVFFTARALSSSFIFAVRGGSCGAKRSPVTLRVRLLS